jgi:hypothetical protein
MAACSDNARIIAGAMIVAEEKQTRQQQGVIICPYFESTANYVEWLKKSDAGSQRGIGI